MVVLLNHGGDIPLPAGGTASKRCERDEPAARGFFHEHDRSRTIQKTPGQGPGDGADGPEEPEHADQIRQAAAEAHTWQQRAQYNESVVHAVRSSLQHMMAQGAAAAATAANHAREGCGESEVDDAASSMYPNSIPDGGKRVLSMACKGCCRGKKSCMLLLPCRHLCLCRECEAMVDACPVCFIRKTASVEAQKILPEKSLNCSNR
ncbi:hypothetical protein KSP40_PGU018176 [Platanthera guangdongensis]|uniref:RING-type domain-containing protein n=1 Tax=Platanthera guangdongensis TaxID=2320717 RepID=A0ABR2N1P5_9ASPA